MRILNEDTDSKIDNLILLLSYEEATELRDALNNLLTRNDERCMHEHINSSDYSKEITVALYDLNYLNEFSARLKKLIREDL